MGGVENPMAFPSPMIEGWQEGSLGMSLRDYFAAKALAGLMLKDPWGDPTMNASYAYNAADAMLTHRAKASS